ACVCKPSDHCLEAAEGAENKCLTAHIRLREHCPAQLDCLRRSRRSESKCGGESREAAGRRPAGASVQLQGSLRCLDRRSPATTNRAMRVRDPAPRSRKSALVTDRFEHANCLGGDPEYLVRRASCVAGEANSCQLELRTELDRRLLGQYHCLRQDLSCLLEVAACPQ